jgi:hypothetical protein
VIAAPVSAAAKVSIKEWIENRLEELADIFVPAVGGFSVMRQ